MGTGCAYAVVALGANRDVFTRGRVNMPMAFMVSTVMARLERWISGMEVGSISFLYAASVYSR